MADRPENARKRACGSCRSAARELRASQAAASRQIGKLETWLSAPLFERSRAGATLTDAGVRFRDGVAAGLAAIHRGTAEAAKPSNAGQAVIARSHETSHFLIMPRYDSLRRTLGEDVRTRILTYHPYIQSLPAGPSADIRLTWDAADSAPQDRLVALREAVRPVCSPAWCAADWKPGSPAALSCGVELCRSEPLELRAGDRARWTRDDPFPGLPCGVLGRVAGRARLVTDSAARFGGRPPRGHHRP